MKLLSLFKSKLTPTLLVLALGVSPLAWGGGGASKSKEMKKEAISVSQLAWSDTTQSKTDSCQKKLNSRSRKLYRSLYELLTMMPKELIMIIVGYDFELDGKCEKTLINDKEIYNLFPLADGNFATLSSTKPIQIWDSEAKCLATTFHIDQVARPIQLINGYYAFLCDRSIQIFTPKNQRLKPPLDFAGCFSDFIQLTNGNFATCNNVDRGLWVHYTIMIWNPEANKLLELYGHKDIIFHLIQLTNGNLASSSKDKTIKIWDLESQACLLTLEGHRGWVTHLIQLYNGNLASSSADKTIKIWNPTTGTCLTTIKWLDDRWDRYYHFYRDGRYSLDDECINCLIQLNNGNIAAGFYYGDIMIYDPESGKCLQTLFFQAHINKLIQLHQSDKLVSLAQRDFKYLIKIWS